MPGIFKRLSANDIKIIPFEAHKQYDTTDLVSIGAETSSLAWSGKNKSTFSTGSRQYYQIDKLYYRNYIQERANRLELNDATYTTQERRLYQSASLLSLSQKTFGSEVQPGSFELNITKGGVTYNIQDDGFGNLYDTDIGKDNFPNEDNRVFYLAPVQAFKREDLNLDIETGNTLVNTITEYTHPVYDDSYFQNVIQYKNFVFEKAKEGSQGILNTTNIVANSPSTVPGNHSIKYITAEHRPYLNFNDEDFCISFYYSGSTQMSIYAQDTDQRTNYILTKEGAQTSPPLGTQAGGNYSTNTTGALDLTSTPANPAFPYRLAVERIATNNLEIHFERFDGENLSRVTGSLYAGTVDKDPTHILVQKTGSKLQVYKNGVLDNEADDITTKPCQNKADLVFFSKRNADGSYYNDGETNGLFGGQSFIMKQFQIWNRSMNTSEIAMISESFTGTYPVGNLFYDNGFAVLTHPKYMELFNGGTLNTLKYKNTHLITENEYQCTMTEDEFEFTTNPTARKIPSIENEDIANFATGSAFKPYVTTVGLHDDDGNFLVVGKLGQPIKASSETDTTFVIRFDT